MELPEPELLHVQGGEAALASILHTCLGQEYLEFHRNNENNECSYGISICHV